jgi:phytol kinase
VLAHQHPTAYIAAILTLALGDAAAALVGRSCGRHPYTIGRARKSLEGSCAFFAVAVVVAAIAGAFVPGALGVAAVAAFALATTLAEALAGDGLDNAAIPLAGLLALRCFTGGLP